MVTILTLQDMDFDDLTIRNNRKNSVTYKEQGNRDDNGYALNHRYSYYRHSNNFKWNYFMETIRTDKELRLLVLFGGIVILAIIIGLILILTPLILKFINYFSQNGIKEIVEYVTVIMDKIWKGTQK